MKIAITIEVDTEGEDAQLLWIEKELISLAHYGIMTKYKGQLVSGGSLPLEGYAPTKKAVTYIELRNESEE